MQRTRRWRVKLPSLKQRGMARKVALTHSFRNASIRPLDQLTARRRRQREKQQVHALSALL